MDDCFKNLLGLLRHFDYSTKCPVIGVTGFPGAGKSTLARKLKDCLPDRGIAVFETDWSFRFSLPEIMALPVDELMKLNPLTLNDEDKIIGMITALASGGDILMEDAFALDTGEKNLRVEMGGLTPNNIILLEGIGVMSPKVQTIVDYTIFIEDSFEACFERHIARDRKRHGITPEAAEARKQIIGQLVPTVTAFEGSADLVIHASNLSQHVTTKAAGAQYDSGALTQ